VPAQPDPKLKCTGLMISAIYTMLLALMFLVALFTDATTTQMRLELVFVFVCCAATMGMAYQARSIASERWPEAGGDDTSS